MRNVSGLLYFLVLIALVFSMLSCGNVENIPKNTLDESSSFSEINTTDFSVDCDTETENGTETTAPAPKIPYFDRMKTSKPTDEAVQKIEGGMTMREVIDLIGYPHGLRWSTDQLFWETDSGECFVVSLKDGALADFETKKYDAIVENPNIVSDERLVTFYDLTQAHIPTDADVLSIDETMTMQEVYEKLGRPHGGTPFSQFGVHWITESGKIFLVDVYDKGNICDENCDHSDFFAPRSFHGFAKPYLFKELVLYTINKD